MSRLAMDQITITDVTDGEKGVSVKIVTPFYALGTAAPNKPTVNPPESIWTTMEPEYIKGKNLYTTQRTVLEDSTFSYSDVSLNSSYKASEQAITTADTANTTAGEAKTTAGEAKATSTEAKNVATEAKTASTTNKNNLDSEIQARNEAIANLKTSVDADIKVVQQKAADAQQAGDTASDNLSTFRTSTESQLNSINGLVGGVRTDVDAVSKKATTLASGLDSANTKITDTSDKLTGLTTTVGNISKTADDSMALSTTNHQDLEGFKTSVQQTYSTKQDTLSQVSTVSQKADAISASLSKDYQKAADSDAKYSTKAELTATSNSITTSVAEIYATKSVVDALKNIADKAIETWQGPGEPKLTKLPASDWTTTDLKKQHSGDVYYDTDSGFAYRFGSADGTTYKWGRISDSDITKALNLASKAQETADGAVAGVTKLNTDIPLTYATKSEVKVTTDGIKADVVEAKRIGQTGVDNAASLAIRANGIDATLSQQAQNLSDNVKAISQVNMRADSLSTSITQVSNKTDLALANARELVINGDVSTDASHWDLVNASTYDSTEHAIYYDGSTSNPAYKIIFQQYITDHAVNYDRVFRARVDLKQKFSGSGNWRVEIIPGGPYSYDLNNNDISSTSYETFSGDIKVPAGKTVQAFFLRVGSQPSDGGFFAKNMSLQDVTEVVAAQSTANTAVSQVSTLSQDLSGFKTQVTQTYETKDASTAKATTAQQNLQGFKNTVQNDYLSKTDAGTTYSTKTETTQTAEALTNKITNVGKDATSALTRITTAEQDISGFKNTVSATYATKSALSDTNGNVTNAQTAASQALANSQELLADPTFIQKWGKWVNQTVANANVWFDTNNGNLMLDPNPKVSQRAILVSTPNLSGTTPVGYDRTYRISCDIRAPWGGTDTIFYVSPANGINLMIPTSGLSKTDYTHLETDVTLKANAVLRTGTTIAIWTPGDAGIAMRNVHVRDITEVAQLQSDVAATYATKSSVQQTATKITSQVETKYATKDDVASKYTTLQQTDNAFDARIGTAQSTAANAKSNAANAQNRIGTMETLVHTDANGVRVGKQKNGAWKGYSVLMNANGSFDVLDPGGGVDARVNTDGLSVMDNTTNKLRLINRSVFNTDPIYMTSSGEWHGNGHHTHNVTWLVDNFDANLGDIRILFNTNFSSAIRVDLGAYIAQAAGNYGPDNGSVSTIRGWCFQIWERKPDGTNVLFQDTQPSKALKAINAVWQQGTQTISGGTFSASFLVAGLKQYSTYYLETRHAGSFYSPREDNGYWCDWDCVNPWACVTPLS